MPEKQELQEPYFIALVPFLREKDPYEVLSDAKNLSNGLKKYKISNVRRIKNGATADAKFLFRTEQEDALNRHYGGNGWRSDSNILATIDYMFEATYKLKLSSDGLLTIRFSLGAHLLDESKSLILTELSSQLFELAKHIVKTLQKETLLPQDFEYARSMAVLSKTPEISLRSRTSDIIFTAHSSTRKQATRVIKDASLSLESSWKRFIFPFRYLRRRKMRWRRTRLRSVVSLALVRFRYWMVWQTLSEHENLIKRVLSGRVHFAERDLEAIRNQMEVFASYQQSISTELGALIGVVGVGLTGLGLMLDVFQWPIWIAALLMIIPIYVTGKLIISINHTVRAMHDDTISWNALFRFDHDGAKPTESA